MFWWMWVVLWIALVSVSALFVVLLGFRIFRQATATMGEFQRALTLLDIHLPDIPADARPARLAPYPAVLDQPVAVREANARARSLRVAARRERRIRRRVLRGQSQMVRDLPHL